MFDAFCLGVALTVGQGSPPVPEPLPPAANRRVVEAEDSPRRIPATASEIPVKPGRVTVYVAAEQPAPDPKAGDKKDPKAGDKKDPPAEPKKEEEKKEEEKKDERGWFMKSIEGSAFADLCLQASGFRMAEARIRRKSLANPIALTWNDRDQFLGNGLLQSWSR